jgi:hypothetical protein
MLILSYYTYADTHPMHTLSVQDIHPTASRRLTLSVLGPYLTKIECGLGGIHKLLFEESLQLDSLGVRSLQQSKSRHANPQTRTHVSAMRAQNNSKVWNPDSICLCSHTDQYAFAFIPTFAVIPIRQIETWSCCTECGQ